MARHKNFEFDKEEFLARIKNAIEKMNHNIY